MENSTVEQGKTMAIISYITIIGTIIAFIMNNSKKNLFASFHIRQMIGIFLIFLIAIPLEKVSMTLSWAVNIFGMILWVIGLIGAIQGKESKVPLLGNQFQEWFKGIG